MQIWIALEFESSMFHIYRNQKHCFWYDFFVDIFSHLCTVCFLKFRQSSKSNGPSVTPHWETWLAKQSACLGSDAFPAGFTILHGARLCHNVTFIELCKSFLSDLLSKRYEMPFDSIDLATKWRYMCAVSFPVVSCLPCLFHFACVRIKVSPKTHETLRG